METWKCATGMLWVVRPNGTNLVQLDSRFTAREGMAILEAMHPDRTGAPWQLWHVDVTDLKVKPITEGQARDLVKRTPLYDVKNNFVTCWGKAIAEIRTRQVPTGPWEMGTGLEIHCEAEPDEKTLAVLPRCASYYLQQQHKSLFTAAASVEVFFWKEAAVPLGASAPEEPTLNRHHRAHIHAFS
ncbi:hypothetical protein [Noviherbaspirillum galbum]|uniref:Uncharacterized protein n=1 Tax=Noviherbaspirillum galbum TaxID=2709383 RepID=A0A6B3SP88_9BURK|nr:hypothetical protein [Noviherbaspirillum galbum]NEX60222.1 hypothetical protein [Noviherbaspirillum galbum]